jgi:hypothetical protein
MEAELSSVLPDADFCPQILKDEIQSKWLASLPQKSWKPICELSNKLTDLQSEEAFKDHLMVDTLFRFLHVKNWKVSSAEKDIRAFFEWRKSFNVDEKVKQYETSQAKKIFDKYACITDFGKDKNGNTVRYSPMGHSDPEAICNLIGSENWFLAHVWATETSLKESRKNSKETGVLSFRYVMLIDVAGFEVGRAMRAIDAYSETAKLMDKYYPDRNAKVLLVNAPWVFSACFKVAKGIMDDSTNEAIGVYGDKPKEWLPDLTALVDPSQIPSQYGGTQKDWVVPIPPKIDKADMLDEIKEKNGK